MIESRRLIHCLLAVLTILAAAAALQAGPAKDNPFGLPILQPAAPDRKPVIVTATTSRVAVTPGSELAIAVTFDIAPHWHIWPHRLELTSEMKDALGGLDTQETQVTLPETLPAWVAKADDRIMQWPEPHPVAVGSLAGEVAIPLYEGTQSTYIPLIVAADAAPGSYTIEIGYYYQACDETHCEPPVTGSVSVDVQVVAAADLASVEDDSADRRREVFGTFDAATAFADLREGNVVLETARFNVFGLEFEIDPSSALGLVLLVLLAFLGGMILNLTPCVLPVIPIKILGLANSAGNPARAFFLGVVMSLGVIAFWMAIGLAILFVSGFDAVSTLFQQPLFTIAVGVFIGAMGFGMIGLFSVKLPKVVYMVNPSHETVHGSFLFGVMTAVLSTPCTAPFMGTAAAWAADNGNPFHVLLTFGAIGCGMALPYFVLSANPKWVDRMPRTGPASELIKQVMGILMFGVAAFFLGVGYGAVAKEPGVPPSQIHWWIAAGFCVIAAVWTVIQTFRITKKPMRRVVVTGGGLLFTVLALAVAVRFTDPGPIKWTYYTPEAYAQAEAEGKVIVLDFTAEWCLNCKTLEKLALFPDRVAELMNSEDVAAIKADLTTKAAPGWEKLYEEGSRTIPLLVIRGPGLDEPFRSEAYTSEDVIRAIERARGSAAAAAAEAG